MLLSLRIQNYALIDFLEFKPIDGFVCITGETGAGKSIVVGALALILGNRADNAALHNASEKCIVEAQWQVRTSDELLNFFHSNELDFDMPLITRREINANGKSRAFVNDSPVSLTILKELSGFLVDVSSQHETLKLCNSDFQMNVLDVYGGHHAELKKFQTLFVDYSRKKDEVEKLIDSRAQSIREKDFLEFQLNEISALNYKFGEFIQLEDDLKILENAEEIQVSCTESAFILDAPETSLLSGLETIFTRLKKSSKVHSGISEIRIKIESVLLELREIHRELERISDAVEFSPDRINALNSRYTQINQLIQKHRLDSADNILDYESSIKKKLNSYEELSETINLLENEIQSIEIELDKMANQIHKVRIKAASNFQKEIQNKIHELGMPDAAFEIKVKLHEKLSVKGYNSIEYLFSANKGSKLSALSDVASGGELSRLMLALKVVIAKENQVSTMIFDEIDTGISGITAAKVGEQLSDLAKFVQVISITHLAQIAGRSFQHFKVFKSTIDSRTTTQIIELTKDERVEELAIMLSGRSDSQLAQQTALELLNHSI